MPYTVVHGFIEWFDTPLSINQPMLYPTTTPLRPGADPSRRSSVYFLSDVTLEIPGPDTAVFRARLNGPAGSEVWVRAWLSNQVDGTLAETASGSLDAGDLATLTVTLHDTRVPENACIRIESAPLATEHVVIIRLPGKDGAVNR